MFSFVFSEGIVISGVALHPTKPVQGYGSMLK